MSDGLTRLLLSIHARQDGLDPATAADPIEMSKPCIRACCWLEYRYLSVAKTAWTKVRGWSLASGRFFNAIYKRTGSDILSDISWGLSLKSIELFDFAFERVQFCFERITFLNEQRSLLASRQSQIKHLLRCHAESIRVVGIPHFFDDFVQGFNGIECGQSRGNNHFTPSIELRNPIVARGGSAVMADPDRVDGAP